MAPTAHPTHNRTYVKYMMSCPEQIAGRAFLPDRCKRSSSTPTNHPCWAATCDAPAKTFDRHHPTSRWKPLHRRRAGGLRLLVDPRYAITSHSDARRARMLIFRIRVSSARSSCQWPSPLSVICDIPARHRKRRRRRASTQRGGFANNSGSVHPFAGFYFFTLYVYQIVTTTRDVRHTWD